MPYRNTHQVVIAYGVAIAVGQVVEHGHPARLAPCVAARLRATVIPPLAECPRRDLGVPPDFVSGLRGGISPKDMKLVSGEDE